MLVSTGPIQFAPSPNPHNLPKVINTLEALVERDVRGLSPLPSFRQNVAAGESLGRIPIRWNSENLQPESISTGLAKRLSDRSGPME